MFPDLAMGKDILKRSMGLFGKISKLPEEGPRSWYLARLGDFFMDGGETELASAAMDLIYQADAPDDLETLTRAVILAVRLGRKMDETYLTHKVGSFGTFGAVQLQCRLLPFRKFPSPDDLGEELARLELRAEGLEAPADREEAKGRLTLAMLLISRQNPDLLPGITDLQHEAGQDPFSDVLRMLRDPDYHVREPLDDLDAALMVLEKELRGAIPDMPLDEAGNPA